MGFSLLLFALPALVQGTWQNTLVEAGVPESAAVKLIGLGFKTADLFLHGCPKEESLEELLRFVLVDSKIAEGVSETNWRFHPVTASLRAVWSGLSGSAAKATDSKALEQVSAAGLRLAEHVAGKKLEASVRDKLRTSFLTSYPGELYCPLWDPSDAYLQLVWAMWDSQDLKWQPWRQVVSKSAWLALEMAKSASAKAPSADGSSALVKLLAKSQGLEEPDEVEVSASFFKVFCILLTRMFAFGIVRAAHLSGLRAFVNRFIELYSAKPLQTGRRCPNLAEAELADQQVWTEVFRLVRSGSSLDDALHEVVVQRDMLASLLVPQIKEPAPPLGKGGKGSGGKGGANGYGKVSAPAGQRSDPYAKREPCRLFAAGKCTRGANCKYAHSAPGSW